jgi:hypothetical protein
MATSLRTTSRFVCTHPKQLLTKTGVMDRLRPLTIVVWSSVTNPFMSVPSGHVADAPDAAASQSGAVSCFCDDKSVGMPVITPLPS